jgi:hypothetical protein
MTKLAQDREMAIREALQSIRQANCGELTPQQLLALYIECEAVQSKQQPDAAYINIARHAFKNVEIHLGCHIDEGTLDKSIKCLCEGNPIGFATLWHIPPLFAVFRFGFAPEWLWSEPSPMPSVSGPVD